MGRPWIALARTVPRLGLRRLARYAQHQARVQFGWYRRHLPVVPWPAPDPAALAGARSPWSLPPAEPTRSLAVDRHDAVAQADRILDGEVQYFGWLWQTPPADWRTHPVTGHTSPSGHWSRVEDLPDPASGDVKWIWEPSRFGWMHQLVRAWRLTDDPRYVEALWTRLESWRDHNPPNDGVNWKCGQECSIRLMVLVWAAGMLPDPGPERSAALWSTVAELAVRIEASIPYAFSQRNPHGLGEAVALELVGHALPNHPRAAHWRAVGRALFVEQAIDQWDEDGYYLSNANNYARVVLRYACVALRVAAWVDEPLPPAVVRRLSAASRYLWQQQDASTGFVPNLGANDGGHLFPLHGCPFSDFRPTLQLATWLTEGRRLYPPGPWDEEALWDGVTLPESDRLPARSAFYRARTSGTFVLRGDETFAAIRCFSHQGRPSQADMLHLDLWHGGRNVFADGGSYQYNEPRGWGKHLKETSGHNTLEVDDRSQMKLASTFLYVDWTKAKVLDSGALIPGWSGEGVEGEHYSYLEPSGVVHRRTVLRRGESVLVIDDALPAGDRPWAGTLRWHFGDSAHWAGEADGPRLTARCDGLVVDVFGPEGAGATLLRGEDHLPETGRSRTYAAIDAFAVLAMRRERAPGAARWITAFGTEALTVQGDDLLWEGLRVPRGPGERPAPE